MKKTLYSATFVHDFGVEKEWTTTRRSQRHYSHAWLAIWQNETGEQRRDDGFASRESLARAQVGRYTRAYGDKMIAALVVPVKIIS